MGVGAQDSHFFRFTPAEMSITAAAIAIPSTIFHGISSAVEASIVETPTNLAATTSVAPGRE
jgi:hypothetical protein